jgi:predicted N-acyltransferase
MTYTLKACGSIDEVGEQSWDACANPHVSDPACGIPYDPFVSYAFLHALEASGSVSPRTGWAPYHVVIEEDEAGVLGVVPMYLKSHSQGEYVFDHNWADAFERAGGRYYPKLQISVPFTPATGRRLLTRPLADPSEIENFLLGGVMKMAENLDVSSVHITFAEKNQWDRMGELEFLLRTHKQFHWQNNNYTSFDDVDTGSRKWGRPYLNREFFSIIGQTMPEHILLIMCKRGDRYIAGAINFIGSECLFGRNWGCVEDHRFLHFEVCYYQAIEFAIESGLKRVEAGAQGPHKLARGYLPTHTYSAHWIVDRSFRDAVHNFLEQEREYVDEEIDYIAEHTPFKKA